MACGLRGDASRPATRCAQFEAQKEREVLDATVAMAANDDEFCRSYGAKPGTPSYVDCRLNLSNQRVATAPTTGR